MKFPAHKTKIICTIGPASRSPLVLRNMIAAGMNVARLNLSHGSFAEHKENIRRIRQAAAGLKKTVSVMIDLPGVKMRVGTLGEPLHLKKGGRVTITTRQVVGQGPVIPVSYPRLPQNVSKGSIIYLSDGFIQLKVEKITGGEIFCRVIIGGTLLSHKGLNVPGARLSVDPVTARDLQAVSFGLLQGVHAFGISFVATARDIVKVREFARRRGKTVFLVAKIERREAVENFDEILKAADAVMIARGDLGIQVPIEQVPVIQKELIRRANIMGRPVVTATQMLGSMTQNIRPTRAEVADVANAIADGTDAVMLSEETAIGEFPVAAVGMMAKIAVSTEPSYHTSHFVDEMRRHLGAAGFKEEISDVISINAVQAAARLGARYILAQTTSGATARRISRFKPDCWILAFSRRKETVEFLNFSYGVYAFQTKKKIHLRPEAIIKVIKDPLLVKKGDTLVLTERRFSSHSGDTDSLGVMTVA